MDAERRSAAINDSAETLRSSFGILRACSEPVERTNGGTVEIIGDFPFMLS
jgi:hypothetical protein